MPPATSHAEVKSTIATQTTAPTILDLVPLIFSNRG
jgi:hypothetical protein